MDFGPVHARACKAKYNTVQVYFRESYRIFCVFPQVSETKTIIGNVKRRRLSRQHNELNEVVFLAMYRIETLDLPAVCLGHTFDHGEK